MAYASLHCLACRAKVDAHLNEFNRAHATKYASGGEGLYAKDAVVRTNKHGTFSGRDTVLGLYKSVHEEGHDSVLVRNDC